MSGIKLKSPVYVKPEQHYCDFLKNWHCYAEPLFFNNKIKAFIHLASVSKLINHELFAVMKLLKKHLLKEYKTNLNIKMSYPGNDSP